LRGDELSSYYSHSFFKGSSVEQRGVGEQQEEYGYYFAFPDGLFYSWSLEPYSEQEKNILHRFRNIIALTFRRYLDLQKAEAQTREAEIELALERVRARTMAMQKSDELPDAANLLFQQIQSLGMPAWSAGYCLFNEDRSAVTLWMSSEGLLQPPFVAPTAEDELFIQMRKGVEQGVDLHVVEMGGKDLEKHYRYMRSLPVVGEILDSIIAAGHPLPTFQIMHQAYFSKGFLLFITYEPVPVAHEIFKRFAKVFDQTYTRFLDLQKAEVQALEATKQASLDRVRGVISSKELTILGVPFIRCGVFIIHEGQQTIEAYLSAPDGHSLGVLNLPFNASDLTYKTVVAWRKNDMLLQHWNKEDFVAWTNQMVSEHQIKDSKTYQGADLPPDSLDLHFVPFAQGMLYVGTMEPLEETKLELVQSLARTFSIAYARYEDFVKLENAKEEIESALTELKATQKQLIQSEKMASLGELTAGIAHEIQNPLNFVNNFSEVSKELIEEVKESIAKGEMADAMDMMADLVQNLEKINEHGKRADSIVKGMLQHSRAGSGQKEATDINVLADECLRLAFHGLRAKDKSFNANFETVFDAEIGKIDVMPQDMGRVLLNLINNAFYTVNEKSKRGEVGYKPMVKVSTEKSVQGLGIRVEDNGDGIPDAIKEKIFQPFFTTKPTGQGTGLGLSLAYDIVKAHGGELTVESKEGEGTVFNIYLPNF
jgi:signal transduction histidine kinase